MKAIRAFAIGIGFSALALLGAGCLSNSPAQDSAPAEQKPVKTELTPLAQDRSDYIDNINIKIGDLEIHLGKLRAYRPNIAPSQQAAFDVAADGFEKRLNAVKTSFEALKASPVSDFYPKRAALNALLEDLGSFYIKTIKDFKIDYGSQP